MEGYINTELADANERYIEEMFDLATEAVDYIDETGRKDILSAFNNTEEEVKLMEGISIMGCISNRMFWWNLKLEVEVGN